MSIINNGTQLPWQLGLGSFPHGGMGGGFDSQMIVGNLVRELSRAVFTLRSLQQGGAGALGQSPLGQSPLGGGNQLGLAGGGGLDPLSDLTSAIGGAGADPLAGLAGSLTGLDPTGGAGIPGLSPDSFSPCSQGAGIDPSLLGGAPQSLGGGCSGAGSLPQILGPGAAGGGLDPTSASALQNLGANYNDPLALMQGFDPGRYLAQNLFNALPQQSGGSCGCSGGAAVAPQLGSFPQVPQYSPLAFNGGFPGAAPGIFGGLNVQPELRGGTGACGARGCCHWEPKIN